MGHIRVLLFDHYDLYDLYDFTTKHFNLLSMSLITVGTMAFDTIETPFGKIEKIIGGSATYVAYAAINFVKPVQQISIVGYDFPKEEMEELKKRGVQLEGVEIVEELRETNGAPTT